MNKQAMEIVKGMTDVEKVRFLEYFGNELFRATPREAILEGIAPEVANIDEVRRFRTLPAEIRKTRLPPLESRSIARVILLEMSKDEFLAPALIKAWETYSPSTLAVNAILSVGFVAAMLLFIATSEIEFKWGNLTFIKKAATVEQIRAVLGPFSTAIPVSKDPGGTPPIRKK